MKERGFTLVELMIAMVLLGLLVAFILPSYNAYVLQARASNALLKLMPAKRELEGYFTLHGELPTAPIDYMEDWTNPDAEIKNIRWSDSRFALEARFGLGAGELDNKILWLVPEFVSATSLSWTCKNHTSSAYALPEKMLPSECRQS